MYNNHKGAIILANITKEGTTKVLKNAKQIEDKVYNGVVYKMRTDIGFPCKDMYIANIYRILIVNKVKFSRSISTITVDDEEVELDVIGTEGNALFNFRNETIIPIYKPTDKEIKAIKIFKERINELNDTFVKHRVFVIASESSNYIRDKYEAERSYEWFAKKYQPLIALWETDRQNVDKTPDLYKREWVIGKKELKRKHKKFFQPNGKSVKIGQLWKKQPFVGRPKYDNNFINTFKIYDSETNDIIFEHDNWGSIVAKVRQHMKDNAYEYYDTGRYAICAGHVKKTDEWVNIIQYDTMTNRYINLEHFTRK